VDKSQVKELLSKVRRIAIIAHRNPDGDAIGSSLGLHHFLVKMGHDVTTLMPTDYPNFLKWMPGNDDIIRFDNAKESFQKVLDDSEILFCLDFNTTSRVGDAEEAICGFEGVKIMIDHHPQPDDYAHHLMSDVTASSTAELIMRFIHLMDGSIPNVECANCLYTGILTDSGSFRFPNTSAQTHRYVAEMMDAGLDHSYVYDQIFNRTTEGRLRLLGHSISEKLTVIQDHHTAFINLSIVDKQQFNFQKGDTEGTVNQPLSIDGIIFSAIFIEDSDKVKISFRSIGDFDVNQFARNHFGGGGHRNAAGGMSELSLKDTLEQFQSILKGYKAELERCAH
jgi:phosphoesterase RecJ-like protein